MRRACVLIAAVLALDTLSGAAFAQQGPRRGAFQTRNGARSSLLYSILPPGWSTDTAHLVTSTGTAVSVTRAGSVQCTTGTGTSSLTTAGSNTSCTEVEGALVEPAVTNLALQSQAIDNAQWALGSGNVTKLTADTIVAPDGTTTAEGVNIATSSALNDVYDHNVAQVASTTYTFSVWVWTDSGTKSFRLARTNTASWVGSAVSATFTATTTPQRFYLNYTTAGGETVSDVTIGSENSTPFNASTGNYYMWGAQVEAAPNASSGTVLPTSYVATTGATASRITTNPVSLPAGLINPALGCLSFDIYSENYYAQSSTALFIWNDGANGNEFHCFYSTISATPAITCRIGHSGGVFTSVGSAQSASWLLQGGATHRVKATWNSVGSSYALYVDGSQAVNIATMTNAPTATPTTFYIFGQNYNANGVPAAKFSNLQLGATDTACQ